MELIQPVAVRSAQFCVVCLQDIYVSVFFLIILSSKICSVIPYTLIQPFVSFTKPIHWSLSVYFTLSSVWFNGALWGALTQFHSRLCASSLHHFLFACPPLRLHATPKTVTSMYLSRHPFRTRTLFCLRLLSYTLTCSNHFKIFQTTITYFLFSHFIYSGHSTHTRSKPNYCKTITQTVWKHKIEKKLCCSENIVTWYTIIFSEAYTVHRQKHTH